MRRGNVAMDLEFCQTLPNPLLGTGLAPSHCSTKKDSGCLRAHRHPAAITLTLAIGELDFRLTLVRLSGRRKKVNTHQRVLVRKLYEPKRLPLAKICSGIGITKPTRPFAWRRGRRGILEPDSTSDSSSMGMNSREYGKKTLTRSKNSAEARCQISRQTAVWARRRSPPRSLLTGQRKLCHVLRDSERRCRLDAGIFF